MRATPLDEELIQHYRMVARELAEGDVVPFLGAGANLCGRPRGCTWRADAPFLPSGGELADYLAHQFSCPNETELARVAQYITTTLGSRPLFHGLHSLFDRDLEPTLLHRFLAELPALLRSTGRTMPHQLIVTTNYDDLLERAFVEAGEPFDLVTYSSEGNPNAAEGNAKGKFIHTSPEGMRTLITIPNQYGALSLAKRSVILKIHGAVDRAQPDGDKDSYVITEDHYIDYLTRTELANLVPVTLAAKLRHSHFLFLGYGLRDWNLRVILHRIAGEQPLSIKSWAIQRRPTPLDRRFWSRRDVDVLDIDLERYISALRGRMRMLRREQPEARPA